VDPNFVRRFQELAEALHHKDVPEEQLKVLVWESFKAYAQSPEQIERALEGRMTEALSLMKAHGVTVDMAVVAKLRAELG